MPAKGNSPAKSTIFSKFLEGQNRDFLKAEVQARATTEIIKQRPCNLV